MDSWIFHMSVLSSVQCGINSASGTCEWINIHYISLTQWLLTVLLSSPSFSTKQHYKSCWLVIYVFTLHLTCLSIWILDILITYAVRVKGMFQLKMKILSLFIYPHVVVNVTLQWQRRVHKDTISRQFTTMNYKNYLICFGTICFRTSYSRD